MKEIVINKCYGGFSLSYEGTMLYAKLCGFKLYAFVPSPIDLNKYFQYNKKIHKSTHFIFFSKKPLNKNGDIDDDGCFYERDIERDDVNLIKVVKRLKKKANGNFAKLKIVKIPNNIQWHIEQYDGLEWVAENHKIWG